MTHLFSREPRSVSPVETKHRTIHTALPAPGTKEILERLDRLQPAYMQADLPIVWTEARGHTVFDAERNRFIDFTSGIFTANVGHSNPFVTESLKIALQNARLDAYDYGTGSRAMYLDALTRWSGYEQALLFSAGTEATECALKLMRLWGHKQGKRRGGILVIKDAFHGRTAGAQAMSGGATWLPHDPDMHVIPWPGDGNFNFPSEDICGVMIETFRGWDARWLPIENVQFIEKQCRREGILLCFDEMQAGFARTGRKFGFEHYDVRPDLVCIGKGMGGGFPLSGVLGAAEVFACGSGDMSSTHSGHPLACAAGLAVIEEIERLDLVRETERKGRLLAECLSRIGPGRSTGLIGVLDMSADVAACVVERAYHRGLLLVYTGRDSIKIAPPLTIPDDALREGLEVLAEAVKC